MNFLDTEIQYVSTAAGIALFRDLFGTLYQVPLGRDPDRETCGLSIEQVISIHGEFSSFATSLSAIPKNDLAPEAYTVFAPYAVELRNTYSAAALEAYALARANWIDLHGGRRAWRRKRREIRRNIKILEQNERRKRARK